MPQIVILAVRLLVGKQRGIEEGEARMGRRLLFAILQQSDRKRRLRDRSKPLAERGPILAADDQVTGLLIEMDPLGIRKVPGLKDLLDDGRELIEAVGNPVSGVLPPDASASSISSAVRRSSKSFSV